MGAFGDAVREARLARGWTQAELARQTKMSQRAVSSWEKGISEPTEATKRRVAEVLPLPLDVVPEDARQRVPGGTPRLADLPLHELSPEEFENFTHSLARALFPDHEVHRAGKTGHTQGGFDVTVEHGGKVLVGIQCKRVSDFGPDKVNAAVAESTTAVQASWLFLSRVASPQAREAMRRHKGWRLWDLNDISHEVHELSRDKAVRLVDRYFPNLRERFLGEAVAPWLEPDAFFRRAGARTRPAHERALVGRREILEEFAAFASGDGGHVGVLVGRGGIGKSKLLHALCECLDGRNVAVRFLERDQQLEGRAFEELPHGKLLVIIDDAHDADAPVSKVVAGVLAKNQQANVLLALRPDSSTRLHKQLSEAGLNPHPNLERHLDDLTVQDAEALAVEALGPDHAYAAARLAAATHDCPYILLAAAELTREGKLDLKRLEGDEELRHAVVESLGSSIGAGQPAVREQILHAVAALQPVRVGDDDFRIALEKLTEVSFDQIVPHLSALVDAGVLLQRGESYRVVPDLLGDALLVRAVRIPGTIAPTGYLERVRRAANGQALAHLIVNSGRVDWQEPTARRGHMVASLWQTVTAEFAAGDAATRVAVLKAVSKVAFYQPRPILALIRLALAHPADSAEVPTVIGISYTVTDQDVRDAAAAALRFAAYDPDVFSEAGELLWELARSDKRPANQHPDHALRVLSELVQYDPRGLTDRQEALPGLVERWLNRATRTTDVHNPLVLLHPLLATEGHTETWQHDAIVFHPFVLNPNLPQVIKLRERVLDLAFKQLESATDARRAVAAIETIGASLTGPMGGFGLTVDDERRAAWAAQFPPTLNRLRNVQQSAWRPTVALALRVRLQWLAEHDTSEVGITARDLVASLPKTAEHQIARALHGGPTDPPEAPGPELEFVDRNQAYDKLLSDTVAEFRSVSAQDVVVLLEQSLAELRDTLGDDPLRSRPFVWTLVTARPDVGEAICRSAAERVDSLLTSFVSSALIALGQAGQPRTVPLADMLLAVGDMKIDREVASAFGLQRSRDNLLPDELPLLRRLVTHPDPSGDVLAWALGAVRLLSAQHREAAAMLISEIPDDRFESAIGEISWSFGPHGKFSWHDLAAGQQANVLRTLRQMPAIDNYLVAEFLADLSKHDPQAVLGVLMDRVEAVENGEKLRHFTAVPYSWPVRLNFSEREDFPDLLRLLREWLAAYPSSMWRHYLGSDLFATVADDYGPSVIQVIVEYLDKPDDARIRAVATMLRSAPSRLVWDGSFVSKVLRAADACSTEALNYVQGALHASMFSGSRRGFVHGGWSSSDTDARDTATRLAEQALPGSVEREFYQALVSSIETWAARSAPEIDRPTDGRDW